MKKSYLLLMLLFITGSMAFGQKTVITGKVTHKDTGEPLAGVNILADKGKGGTVSKTDGTYSIQVDKATTTLIFSFVGFTSQTVAVSGRTSIDVALAVSTATIDEVVVIGYGTQRKSHLTGAVSKYKNEKLDEAPVSRLDQALQGKIAGVQIQNTSSEAGSTPRIRVRGVTSINASTEPLVVVDGAIVPDGLAFVNMGDVESVEVLKDAASAAIYGSRASGGVILVTTKSGKTDKPKYTFKFSTGAKSAYERYPMMTTSEYTNLLYYEAALKSKDPSITPPTGTAVIANNEKAAYIVENVIMGGHATDWQDAALRNATVRNIQASVSGGSKQFKYFISGAAQKDQGMMYHSEYDKYSLRNKLDITLSKRAKITFNINPTYIKRERPSVNYIDFVRFQSFLPVYHTEASAAFVSQNPQWSAIRAGDFAQARHFNQRQYSGMMPDGTIYTSTGVLDPFNTSNNTPKSIMETRTIKGHEYRVLSNGDLTFNILPGLDFKTMASIYVNYARTIDFAKRNSSKDGELNRGTYTNRLYIDLLSENTLNYAKKFRDHSFSFLVGFSTEKIKTRDEQATGLDFPSDNITTLNNAVQLDQSTTYNFTNTEGLASALSRITYDYQSKYLFSASFRADGSSKFATGHRWGTFPSISIGWVPTQEKFMEKLPWVSNLKIRGSWGATGNNKIPDNSPYDLLFAGNYSFGQGNGTSSQGLVPNRDLIGNSAITWERTFQYNGGLDLGLFNNGISLSLDVYHGKTEKLLLRQNTLAIIGASQTWNNIGSLSNNGIELELTTSNFRRRNFKWTTSANISHNSNKVVELGGEAFFLNQGERTENYLNKVGEPFVQFFGYKTDGVWLSQQQINDARAAGLNSTLSNLFVPGGLKLVDLNGDNVIDDKDRTVIGNPYPDFTWGITNNITYKDFDFSILVQGVKGGELINGDPNYNETKRYNRNYNTNRWLSPMFPGDGKTPYSTVGFNWMLTDYVVEDASYYALREISAGYTLPKKMTKNLHVSSMRLYFSAQNLYFHGGNNYRGINPEARFQTGPYSVPGVEGYQRGSFPLPRTILFGLDVNF